MELTQEVLNGLLVIKPKGRVDSGAAAAFEGQCASLIDEGPAKVIVDFSQVDYISSAGLRALLIAAKQAKALGRALTLCGLKGGVREVMAVSGLDTILGAHADVAHLDAKQLGGQWLISAAAIGPGVCPDCGKRSTRRHG